MRRLSNPHYQQRNLLLLLPLMLLAIVTWILDDRITPGLEPELRDLLLRISRTLFPCLFALTVALLMPLRNALLRIICLSLIYLILWQLLRYLMPNFTGSGVLCALASISFLLVFPENQDERGLGSKFFIIEGLIAFVLPFLTLISLLIVINQIRQFVLAAFNESFGQSLLSMIFAPIFLILQSLGFQEIVGKVALLRYQSDMVIPFINSIYITNIFSLPTVIIARSFFVNEAQRLFLIMLAMLAVLTSSVGTCVSLICIILIIFWPGTFAILLLCSLLSYFSSYLLSVQPFTVINNLYIPDMDLSLALPFFYSQSTLTLEITGILMPITFIFLTMIISRESAALTRRRHDAARTGIQVSRTSNPDLFVIAYLRALGGLSNISAVEEKLGILKFSIVSPERLSLSSLSNFSLRPAEYDRFKKVLYCEAGEQSSAIARKISMFLSNELSAAPQDAAIPPSFVIRPMPHVHHHTTMH